MVDVTIHEDCGHTIEAADRVPDPCPHCGQGLFDLMVVWRGGPVQQSVLVLECCGCGASVAPDAAVEP